MTTKDRLVISILLGLSLLSCAAMLRAQDKTEEKLADRLIKAQRQVERANHDSDQAAAALESHCKGKSQTLRVKPNGLLGCVTVPAEPAKPPASSKPDVPPKTP